MFGSCLPMILSIVIFIFAINGFQDYSRYQNRQYFYEMACAYNNVIYSGLEVDGEFVTLNDSDEIVVDGQKVLIQLQDLPAGETKTFASNGVNYSIAKFEEVINSVPYKYFTITSDNSYVVYKRYYSITNGQTVVDGAISYSGNEAGLINNDTLKTADGKTYSEFVETEPALKEDETIEELFIKKVARHKSALTFHNNGSKFLWVKNIWKPDSAFANPIDTDYEEFKTSTGYTGGMQEDGYSELTAELSNYKSTPNGYFILVLLTAGISLLHQLITTKTQKAQMELQTVDGQGAQTQKMMNIMMPIMMGVFAFMYTAAFSIYIVVNSLFSILTMFGVNAIVDAQMKKESKNSNKNKQVIRGRVYEPKKQENSQPQKNKKKQEIEKHDFLSGYGDKKKKK